MSKTNRLDKYPTIPIENIVDLRAFTEEYMEFCRQLHPKCFTLAHGKHLVEYHQKKLGKQDFTFTAAKRYWVWDFAFDEDMLRILVNNTKGVSLEVSSGASEEKVFAMLHRYYEVMLS